MRRACGISARREVMSGRREIREYSENVSRSISESDMGFAAQVLRRLYADFAYKRRRICARIRLKIHLQEVLLRRVCVDYTLILRIDGAGLAPVFG
jgi:hypothetical protein